MELLLKLHDKFDIFKNAKDAAHFEDMVQQAADVWRSCWIFVCWPLMIFALSAVFCLGASALYHTFGIKNLS